METTHDYKAKYEGRFAEYDIKLDTGISNMVLTNMNGDPEILAIVSPYELDSILDVLAVVHQ